MREDFDNLFSSTIAEISSYNAWGFDSYYTYFPSDAHQYGGIERIFTPETKNYIVPFVYLINTGMSVNNRMSGMTAFQPLPLNVLSGKSSHGNIPHKLKFRPQSHLLVITKVHAFRNQAFSH
jgi:hypothetical protein